MPASGSKLRIPLPASNPGDRRVETPFFPAPSNASSQRGETEGKRKTEDSDIYSLRVSRSLWGLHVERGSSYRLWNRALPSVPLPFSRPGVREREEESQGGKRGGEVYSKLRALFLIHKVSTRKLVNLWFLLVLELRYQGSSIIPLFFRRSGALSSDCAASQGG